MATHSTIGLVAATVRYLGRHEYDLAARFLSRYWKSGNNVYARSPALFEWTFGGRGLWDRDGYSVAVAEDDSEVIGFLGAVPFTFNSRGVISPALWLMNWLVLPEHRAGGAGLQLLRAFWREPFRTLVAFGMNDLVVPLYRGIGWSILPDVPRYFLVLPGNVERMVAVLGAAHPDWTPDRTRSLASAFVAEGNDREATVMRGRTVPEHWDERGWSYIQPNVVGAVRDVAYLRWRYVEHPVFEYRFITAAEGDRLGLLVWRLETIRASVKGAGVELDRIGRLVEFLPASRHNASALIGALRRDALDGGALAVDYYGYHGIHGGWLADLGLRRTAIHHDGAAIPARFQPLDGRGGRIRSAITSLAPPPDISEACAWYWTKSDSDQDRPN